MNVLTEEEFLNAVSLIAASLIAVGYGCNVTKIDVEHRIVNVSGDKELECAIAIGDFFEKYETCNGIETVMGWPK